MKVDKITKDLIGREAKHYDWPKSDPWYTVLAVDETSWWGFDTARPYHATFNTKDEWEIKDLPEPRKKPSERIEELIKEKRGTSGVTSMNMLVIVDSAIIQYLDEREENK